MSLTLLVFTGIIHPDGVLFSRGGHRVANVKETLIAELKSQPCLDCRGRFHRAAMEFDHLPQFKKLFNLSQFATHTLLEIHQEAKKCEVVCANCHRVRTWNRMNHTRIPKHVRVTHRTVKLNAAMPWLQNILAAGPVSSQQIYLSARLDGIAIGTLRRASSSLQVRIYQHQRQWFWSLKGKPHGID
jgi:hypothetical protein